MKGRRVAVGLAALALIAAACSSGGGATTAPSVAPTTAASAEPTTAASTGASPATVGEGEGALNLVSITATSPPAIRRSVASPDAETPSYSPVFMSWTISDELAPTLTVVLQPVAASNG